MTTTMIIGIDCASNAKDIGLAVAKIEHAGSVRVIAVTSGGRVDSVPGTVAGWLKGVDECLLALDAPLGWPIAMGTELGDHVAGKPIATAPNLLFRRDTDRTIHQQLRKTPLDVGADRIARTAHAALALLQSVRDLTSLPIPLAWGPDHTPQEISAIEVYPAGTLLAHGLPASGYKKKDQQPVRRTILSGLSKLMALPADQSLLLDDADALDAAVCLLAAADFLNGCCIQPQDQQRAQREGWIWVKKPPD